MNEKIKIRWLRETESWGFLILKIIEDIFSIFCRVAREFKVQILVDWWNTYKSKNGGLEVT